MLTKLVKQRFNLRVVTIMKIKRLESDGAKFYFLAPKSEIWIERILQVLMGV